MTNVESGNLNNPFIVSITLMGCNGSFIIWYKDVSPEATNNINTHVHIDKKKE